MSDHLPDVPSSAEPDKADQNLEDLESLRARLISVRNDLANSERASEESRKRDSLLRNELQHRMRNMLALIRSVFSRTAAAGGSLDDLSDHFTGRLDAITRCQSAYISSARGHTDLEAMIWEELRVFRFDDRLRVNGPTTAVSPDTALILGLAFHELATNSIKFGALSNSNPDATLRVSWRRQGDTVTLSWVEFGVPILAPAPLHRGFGREFIEDALSYHLGATASFHLRPGGLESKFEFKSERPTGRW